jgi:hypothetical protein
MPPISPLIFIMNRLRTHCPCCAPPRCAPRCGPLTTPKPLPGGRRWAGRGRADRRRTGCARSGLDLLIREPADAFRFAKASGRESSSTAVRKPESISGFVYEKRPASSSLAAPPPTPRCSIDRPASSATIGARPIGPPCQRSPACRAAGQGIFSKPRSVSGYHGQPSFMATIANSASRLTASRRGLRGGRRRGKPAGDPPPRPRASCRRSAGVRPAGPVPPIAGGDRYGPQAGAAGPGVRRTGQAVRPTEDELRDKDAEMHDTPVFRPDLIGLARDIEFAQWARKSRQP